MAKNLKAHLLAMLEGLITEGNHIVGYNRGHDAQSLARFFGGCSHLASVLGEHGTPWLELLVTNHIDKNGCNLLPDQAIPVVNTTVGTLQAIQRAVALDWLFHVEDLVRAETFDDLLEQADYLSENGYGVAAAILCRAVLEEHLRDWCRRANITPQRPKATINDYNQALYGGKAIDKIVMKQVESLATIGNDAAHGQPVSKPDVERLRREVREFLQRHAI